MDLQKFQTREIHSWRRQGDVCEREKWEGGRLTFRLSSSKEGKRLLSFYKISVKMLLRRKTPVRGQELTKEKLFSVIFILDV